MNDAPVSNHPNARRAHVFVAELGHRVRQNVRPKSRMIQECLGYGGHGRLWVSDHDGFVHLSWDLRDGLETFTVEYPQLIWDPDWDPEYSIEDFMWQLDMTAAQVLEAFERLELWTPEQCQNVREHLAKEGK